MILQDGTEFLLPLDNSRDPSVRVTFDYKNERLFNCDVCWTCRTFDVNSFKCGYYDVDEALKVDIKNPEFFRCTFWESGHYGRTRGKQ